MRKRNPLINWFRSITASGKKRSAATRRTWLEQLEPRYALTAAPVAVADSYFDQYSDPTETVQFLPVLQNDTDTDTNASYLFIGEVGGASVTVNVGITADYSSAHGTFRLTPDHKHFDYTPAAGFTGIDSITYKVVDQPDLQNPGPVNTSNLATVTINVHPFASMGDNVPGSIVEGDGLHLDDYRLDDESDPPTLVHRSAGPNLTYFWYFDANPGNINPDAFYVPPPSAVLLNGPGGNSDSVLDLTWQDLNVLGVVDGTPSNSPIYTLKVVDANGHVAYDARDIGVIDLQPEAPVFTVEPAGGCGGNTVLLTAMISDTNPLEHNFTIEVDWNWDILNGEFPSIPDEDTDFDVADNDDGTFTFTALHTYDGPGYYLPHLFIHDHNSVSGEDEDGEGFIMNGVDNPAAFPDFPVFVNVTGGDAPTNVMITGALGTSPEGTQIDLGRTFNGGCGSPVYAWSVTKNNSPYATGSDASFSFIPDDDASYVVSLTVDGVPAEDQTIAVTNVAPTLTLAGTSSASEGLSYTLDLSSNDPGADTIDRWTINWGDGIEIVNGNPPSVTHTYPEGPDGYTVTATATDEDGTFAASNTVNVTVNNVAPVVAPITGPSAGVRYQTLPFSNDGFTDVADDADATTTWSVLNSALVEVATGSGVSFNFTPTVSDTYTVNCTVDDHDGGVTTVSSSPVIVTATLVDAGALYVGGTSGGDTFVFTPTATPGQYTLVLNSVNQGTFSPTEVRIFGGPSADSITLNGDSNANQFGVHADRLEQNAIPFYSQDVESRTINALGSGDTITVTGGSATVNGGPATDTLTAVAGTNDWHITAQNAGDLNGQVTFTSIEHLIGGSGADTFHLSNGVGVGNNIDGGGGTDTLDYALYTTAVSVNLQSGNATHTGGTSSIEAAIGGTAIDRLSGANATNLWTLTGLNSGNVNGAFAFSSFENLDGGSHVDTFRVLAGANVTGTLDGNAGADVLDYSSYGSGVTVNLETSLSTAVAGFANIAGFVGSAAADTLIGKNVNNTWTVTSATAGSVGSTDFSGFESLQGGTANDTFKVNEFLTSGISINGGNSTGIDKLDYAAYATAVNVNLDAGSATGFASVAQIENVAGGDGNDIIRGDGGNNMLAGNKGNDIILGRGGNDTLNGNAGRDILIGGEGADTIVGNADEDILIAGTTTHDGVQSALDALLAEWTSAGTYAQRTGHIMGTTGGGLNGGIYLKGDDGAGQTVLNDSDVDTLTGSAGVDWYFANQTADNGGPLDIVTDKTASELWNDTDF